MTSTMHTYSRSILPAGEAPSIYTVGYCLAELGIDHQFLAIIDPVTVPLLIFKAIILPSLFSAGFLIDNSTLSSPKPNLRKMIQQNHL
jgi:hypothetical protein